MSSTKPMVFHLVGREWVKVRFIIITAVSMKSAKSNGESESPCGIPLPSLKSWVSPQWDIDRAFRFVIRFIIALISVGSKFFMASRSANFAGSTES